MTDIPAFVPEIEGLLQGTHFDIATSLSESHSNEFTTHPIEDPKRSFLMDHTREAPAELSLTIEVSTTPAIVAIGDAPVASSGMERISTLYDALMAKRAAQSVDTSAFLSVYTGTRVFRNMAIKSITVTRDPATPNVEVIDLQLQEFRFAAVPGEKEVAYIMDANHGARDERNQLLVLPKYRPLAEGTIKRGTPHMPFTDVLEERMIAQAAHALGVPALTRYGINIANGTVTDQFKAFGG